MSKSYILKNVRVVDPNRNIDEVMDTKSIHAYEHLGATFLRNHPIYKDKVISLELTSKLNII